jgi:hypothetical protein
MEQKDLFSTVLRWLRYVLENKISALYSDEAQKDIYVCPTGFPKISEKRTIDIVNDKGLYDYIKSAREYQGKRKLFLSRLKDLKLGFYLNFISREFIINIVARYFLDREGLNANVKDLFISGFMDEKLKNNPNLYENKEDQDLLIDLMKKTKLYLTVFKLTLYDKHRVMSVKAIEYDGVVVFWEPTFQGDLVLKNDDINKPNDFFRFVNLLNFKDIIKPPIIADV